MDGTSTWLRVCSQFLVIINIIIRNSNMTSKLGSGVYNLSNVDKTLKRYVSPIYLPMGWNQLNVPCQSHDVVQD